MGLAHSKLGNFHQSLKYYQSVSFYCLEQIIDKVERLKNKKRNSLNKYKDIELSKKTNKVTNINYLRL
jgi:uncharacterized protein (UPF0335 family)